jgi:hypothetical protein
MFASKDLMFGQQSGGYQIIRSVRLRSSASAYFSRAQATGNTQKATWSGWIKRGALTTGTYSTLFNAGTANTDAIVWNSTGDSLRIWLNGAASADLITTQQFRDPSAWYHIVVAIDTTQATPANRILLYVNGVQVTAFTTATYPTSNYTFTKYNTSGQNANLGGIGASYFFDGYMTEVNWIDGQQLTPTSFGAFDAVTGVWNPKAYSGTYGTNGFYLNFKDATSTTTIGYDYSGNSNNWTANNISVTAGTTYDSMVDSPTNYGTDTAGTGATARGNYAVLNATQPTGATYSNGNLFCSGTVTCGGVSSLAMSSGKWYAEVVYASGSNANIVGIMNASVSDIANTDPSRSGSGGVGYYALNGNKYIETTASAYGATYTTGNVIGIAVDMDNNTVEFFKDGTSQGVISTTINTTPKVFTSGNRSPAAHSETWNFGQRPFTYQTPGTNRPAATFKALCTQNLPTATVSNGANYMAATLYTGSASTQSVSNAVNSVSFQPDLVWVKDRSTASTQDNKLTDSVRGVTKGLISNTTGAETTDANGVTAFNTNGFSLGTGTRSYSNSSGDSYVGWQWKGGGTATNIAIGQYGTSIPSIASSVSANTTAGFSVATYTGTGAAGTVGHGLGVAPSMIIIKSRDNVGGARDWYVYNSVIGNTNFLQLDTTLGSTPDSGTLWNSTSPTQYVFSLNTSGAVNVSTGTYVAYCFTPIAGYSAFGSYTGNSAADGAFIYCGFRPRYILHKASSTTSQWMIWDTSRNTYNVLTNAELLANSSNGEGVGAWGVEIDILSNGFKFRGFDNANFNYSGVTYIYAAFAENPFTISRAR